MHPKAARRYALAIRARRSHRAGIQSCRVFYTQLAQARKQTGASTNPANDAMKNFLSRIFGQGGKDKEAEAKQAEAEAEADEHRDFGHSRLPDVKIGFANTVLPSNPDFLPSGYVNPNQAATQTLNLVEQKEKEAEKIARIKRMFRDAGRSRSSSLEPHQTIELVEEKYGRIWKMIIVMWGSLELHRKLQEILYIDTDGRAGFSFDVLAVLMRVHDIHTNEFGFHGGVHEDRSRRGLSASFSKEEVEKLRQKDASVKVEARKKSERDRW